MHNIRFLDILKSPNAILIVLVLALVAQIPHAADVFRGIGHAHGILAYIHSYFFAIALELAVLVFVVQNRQNESYGFAAVSIAMNLSYYYLIDVSLFSFGALPSWLVSVALPAAIARYSHVVVEAQPHAEQPSKRTTRTTKATTTDPQTEPEPVQPQAVEDVQSEPLPDALITIDKRQRAQQLHDEGLSYPQIAKELGVHRNTIANWLKQTNGTMEAAQ